MQKLIVSPSMQKKILRKGLFLPILFFFILITSCTSKTSEGYTILQGNVSTISEQNRINKNGEWEELSIDKNGHFSDTLSITSPQYVSLSFGEMSTRIYVNPSDQITISVDSTFHFEGANAVINDYLYQYHQDDSKQQEFEFKSHKEVFSQQEVEYVAYRDSIKNEKLNHLHRLPENTKAFQSFHQKEIEYQYHYDVARYPNYHSYYFNNYVPTEIITSFYKNVPIDNDAYAKNYTGYLSLVDLILDKKIEHLKDASLSPLAANLSVLSEIESPTILHYRLNKSLYYFTVNEPDMETTLSNMLVLSKLDKTKNLILDHYQMISKLKPGSPAPAFDFENYSGEQTKLTDFKGKYVYVDVWATWCGPCIKEIPHLKKLEEEFCNANIEFVSISLDSRRFYKAWRTMIKNKELTGVQLIADNGWDSAFVTDYGIQGLPRFMLLDDEGNIVSADVEKPSDPKLRKRLQTLGI